MTRPGLPRVTKKMASRMTKSALNFLMVFILGSLRDTTPNVGVFYPLLAINADSIVLHTGYQWQWG